MINLIGNIGITGPLNIHSCREVIDEAFLDTEAVILNINSFGGSPAQSDLINTYIKEKSARQEPCSIFFKPAFESTITSLLFDFVIF